MLERHLIGEKGGHNPVISALLKNDRPLVLFGAGATGKAVLESCRSLGINVTCFCDNNPAKEGTKHAGLDVISYKTLKEQYPDCNIIITIGTTDFKDVNNKLNNDAFNRIFPFAVLLFDFWDGRNYIYENLNSFEKLYDLLEDELSKQVLIARLNYIIDSNSAELEKLQTPDEYFDASIFSFTENEYFIDAGSLDGQTALEFAKRVPKYNRIVCFEPDERNYCKTLKNLASLTRTEVYPVGLWSAEETLRFESNGGNSSITQSGEHSIEVKPLDKLLSGQPVTFIKMDIEGAEVEAVSGAADIIRSQKPKLAICVYHSKEHIIKIPFLLKKLVPEYKIYLRHHSPSLLDTVCYATI